MSQKKRRSIRLSQEEAREAIKVRRYDIAGVMRPDPEDLANLMETIESLDYVSLSEFVQLLLKCERQVTDRFSDLSSTYAMAIPLEVASRFLASILRVLSPQRDIEQTGSDREATDIEVDQLRSAVRAAAKIAREVKKYIVSAGAPPSLEKVDQMIKESGLSVRTQLEAARFGLAPITLPDNQQLPEIAPMPKSLMSELKHKVTLKVHSFNDRSGKAEVEIIDSAEPHDVPLALEGLTGVSVPASIVELNGKVRRAMISAQLAKISIDATVEVTRAFREADAKLNALTIVSLDGNVDLASAVALEANQLKLDFGN